VALDVVLNAIVVEQRIVDVDEEDGLIHDAAPPMFRSIMP
jgi:hypothetical protein